MKIGLSQPLFGGVPGMYRWFTNGWQFVPSDDTLMITPRAGLRVTIKGKNYISACRIVHDYPHFNKAGPEYLKNKRPSWCHLLFYFTPYVRNMFRALIYPSWPASWSSGQGLWLVNMRSWVRFPVLPWELFLAGKHSRGDHGLGS